MRAPVTADEHKTLIGMSLSGINQREFIDMLYQQYRATHIPTLNVCQVLLDHLLRINREPSNMTFGISDMEASRRRKSSRWLNCSISSDNLGR